MEIWLTTTPEGNEFQATITIQRQLRPKGDLSWRNATRGHIERTS